MEHIVLLVRKECGGGRKEDVPWFPFRRGKRGKRWRGGEAEGWRGGVNPLLLTLPAELTVGSASNPTGLEFIDGSVSFYGMWQWRGTQPF